MPVPDIIDVDPAELHLPPSRLGGADPVKLQRQISRYGKSMTGMPTLLVWRGSDGRFIISDGVTRATRIARLVPGQHVTVEVIASMRVPASRFPRIKDKLP